MTSTIADSAVHQEIPPPPRRLTPRGRRRSWNERPVRVWMILTLLVLLATAYVTARDLSSAVKERHLIHDGLLVHAKVDAIDGYSKPDRSFSRDTVRRAKFSYRTPSQADDAPAYDGEQDLPLKPNSMIAAGDRIDVRVDPNDPTNVTAQTQPTDWLANLAVVTLFVAGLTAVILVTLWQQRRVVRVWREGEAVEGIVVDFQQASIAPRSRIVRFTFADGDDQRVFATLWPNSAGQLEAGDAIDLVVLSGNGNRAIVAGLYG